MTSDSLLTATTEWIIQAALTGAGMEELLDGTAERLFAAGIPLSRAHLTFRTLHPSFESVSTIWRRGKGVSSTEFVHGSATAGAWRRSPFAYMVEHRITYLRRPLAGEEAVIDFPVLEDLVDEGVTDYFAVVVPFDSQAIAMQGDRPDGIATSWVTDRAGGFADSHIEAIRRLVQRLAIACKLGIREQISRNVARTYLGESAGQQVLNGNIRLGDHEIIDAVVWIADLRDSTGKVERHGMDRYLAMLNGFLECTAGAVQVFGGEILAYPGDAVLAIFRDEEDTRAAERAIRAAAESRRRLHDVNANLAEAGHEPLRAGLGIHRGSLAFGNIGAGGRQAFTVIGPAVNAVHRLESMTKTTGFPLILSEAVASLLVGNGLKMQPLGLREVRGSEAPMAIYGAAEVDLLPYNAPAGYAETVLDPLSGRLEPA